MINYIETRLWQWADWSNSGKVQKRATIEYRLIREGGVLIRGTGARPEPVDEEAEEMEAAVRALDFDMRSLARRRYLRGEPVPEKNRNSYYDDLHRMHIKVMEWIQENG